MSTCMNRNTGRLLTVRRALPIRIAPLFEEEKVLALSPDWERTTGNGYCGQDPAFTPVCGEPFAGHRPFAHPEDDHEDVGMDGDTQCIKGIYETVQGPYLKNVHEPDRKTGALR